MKSLRFLTVLLLFAIVQNSYAQNDCAAYPKTGKFDTLTYIKSSIPTSASKGSGLWLGQGTMLRNGSEVRPAFIPSNHPEWAIAIAVAWNYTRNTINRVEYPQIGYWMGTVVQETELGCVAGTTWDAAYKASNNMANANTIMGHDGCFQIEGPGSAYGQLSQNYPLGRFPLNLHQTLIEGPTNFETSAMVKSYFDVYTTSVYNNYVGWDVYESIDCTIDPYAYIKTSASGYNGGINGFANNASKFTGALDGNNCWGGFAATTANYANDVAKWVSVLENDPSYCEYPAGSSFDSYYNGDMTWTMVNNYMNSISIMYPEVNWAALRAKVQATFNALAVGGVIKFQQLGDVVDAIVINLPKDYPQTVEGSPVGINIFGCSGNKVPYGHFEIINGAQTVCLGESVTLNIVVDAGGGPAPTFKWFKTSAPSTILATTQTFTISPSVVGSETYGAEVCNAAGCYRLNSNECSACVDPRNLCGVKINAKKCSNCTFSAAANSVNTPCKGTPGGKINLILTNTPTNYKVSYVAITPVGRQSANLGNSSGNTYAIDNVRDGSYNITLTDINDTNCKAKTTVIVGYTNNTNYYIDGDITSTANCVANLKAEIKELPAPCNWKVKVHVPVFFQWENPVNFGVTTSSGLSNIDRYTRTAPKPEIDAWTDAQIFESVFSLSTGDVMTFKLALTNTPGATQWRDYEVNVYDENNVKVYTKNIPAGSAKADIPFTVGNYAVTCPATIPNYTFTWSPAINGQTNTSKTSIGNVPVDKLLDKSYTVTAIDVNAPLCSLKDIIIVPKDPSCNTAACTKPSATVSGGATFCAGDSTQLSVALVGTQPFKIKYSDGTTKFYKTGITASPYKFFVKTAGTYKIDSVWDATCDTAGKGSAVVVVSPKPVLTISGDTTICLGETAQINLALTGTAPFNITATIGATVIPFTTNLTAYTVPLNVAGTYFIKVTDATGCSVTKKVSVIINPLPTLDLGVDKVICSGASVTLDAGATFSSYAWTKTKTGNAKTIVADAPGEYKLTVTDANGCKKSDSLNVTQGTAVVIDFGGATKTICAGSSVSLAPSITGGDGTYTYKWTNAGSGTSATYNANAAGFYALEVTDGKGCKDKDSAEVVLSPKPVLSISGDTTICLGETAQINLALTGTAPFNITATIGATVIPFTTNLTLYTVPLNVAGTYFIKVTDATSCAVTKKVSIIINPLPTLDLGADKVICSGANVTLDAAATFSSYAWTKTKTGNAKTIVADAPGEYKLTVTDANGCKNSDSLNVTQGTAVVIDFGGATKTICAGSSVSLAPSITGGDGTYTYKWSNAGSGTAATFNANAVGFYALDVTDGKGCKDKDSAEVVVSSNLMVTLANKTICAGDSTVINSGYSGAGYTFLWSNGDTTASIKAKTAATYTVDVANGTCTGSGSMQLTVNGLPAANLGADKNVCATATATLDAGTFASWLWTSGETTQTISKGAGTYGVTVTDANGCKDVDSIVVNSIAKPNPNVILDVATCAGGNITLDVSSYDNGNGPYTYKWNNNSTASTLALTNVNTAALHFVDITDKFGCVGRDSANITIQASLGVQITGTPDTLMCAGSSITLASNYNTAGGYNLSWSTGSNADNILVNSAGLITLTVDDGNGCTGTDVMTIVVNVAPDMILVPTTASVCSGDAASIGHDYGAGHTYLWTPGNATSAIFSTFTGGTYTVKVTNNKGCFADTNVVVNAYTKPLVDIVASVDACSGETITLQDNSGQTSVAYQWTKTSTGATVIATTPTLQITTSDSYRLKVIDANTCFNSDVTVANFRTTPVVNLINGMDSATICGAETLNLNAGNTGAGITYAWSTGNQNTQTITVSSTGNYSVIVSNGNCSDTDVVKVKSITIPKGVLSDALFAVKPDYCFAEENQGVPLSAIGVDGNLYNYLWSTGETTPQITITKEGTYMVNITQDQCQEGDEITVVDYCPTTFFIPDAFSPNYDNKNDVFKIYGSYIPNFEIHIFNRWGEVVYHSTDYLSPWNGTYLGELVQEDVYVVRVTYGINQMNGSVQRRERLQKLAVLR